jgi:hypothetical protein
MKFDSLEALKLQMASDVQEIVRRFGMPVFPSVAIVILNYNTSGHLRLFLPSVLAHAEGARVIVADNGSPDDSLEVLAGEFPQVEVIALPKNLHAVTMRHSNWCRPIITSSSTPMWKSPKAGFLPLSGQWKLIAE